jgi:hypothetical protein
MAAYVRLYQPETPTSTLSQSSYLRLGAYSSSDEASLVTGLTTTTSSDSSSSQKAVDSANSSATTSSSMGDEKAKVTDTQTGTYTTSNNGVLTYTDQDFQANVQGAALMLIGKGHTTEVTASDALYQVNQGGYTLNASNDIKIYAGFNGTPANLELTASDYIKQTANGPLSVTTFGNSDTQTVGNSSEFFFGTKFSCMIGMEMTFNIAASLTVSIGYDISMFIGGDLSIVWVFDNSFVWGNQIALQTGIYFKAVTGSYINTVIGNDVKTAFTSSKILTETDFKVAPTADLKTVGVNGTVCDVDLKKVTGPTLTADQIKYYTASMVATVKDMEAHAGDVEVRSKASLLVM